MISRNIAGCVSMVAMCVAIGFAVQITQSAWPLIGLYAPMVFGAQFWKNK